MFVILPAIAENGVENLVVYDTISKIKFSCIEPQSPHDNQPYDQPKLPYLPAPKTISHLAIHDHDEVDERPDTATTTGEGFGDAQACVAEIEAVDA